MAGETDLDKMLATLSVKVRDGLFTVISLGSQTPPPSSLGSGIQLLMAEDEGVTIICSLKRAEDEGWPVDYVASWLTLQIHSSLEAVGLTAAISTALATEQISCNVLAGYYHDHILVPADRTDDAVACLEALRLSYVV